MSNNQLKKEKNEKLNVNLVVCAILAMFLCTSAQAQKKIDVEPFEKVIVSPHIEVIFKEGAEESVTIKSSKLPLEKIHIEEKHNQLHLYLEGAKLTTKSERVESDEWHGKKSIYNGTMVTAIVAYRKLKELSLRGEETFTCESRLDSERFRLSIYGESKVYLNDVDFSEMKTTVYGESFLEIKTGEIDRQKITAYGETVINTLGVKCGETKITAYGEGSYRLHAMNDLRITAFGEATVAYAGSPEVSKGMVIGEARIQQMDQ
ncbi:DUF2807 domain-containing protein [Euzebyella marina]|uniref:DUF2807 domain-containing protein n=1 Tax=Euzebyella marina TaxID=1761453 RepID=A0A3G2LB18_9FLAO|nr:head GIN domain-containing protein [Euzebyella marina]AYN69391.1 DUF2807 domain-containing protein [Euzebyella marina]